MIFDNSKIKSVVPDFNCTIPFTQGVKEIVGWYKADSTRQIVDSRIDNLFDTIIKAYSK